MNFIKIRIHQWRTKYEIRNKFKIQISLLIFTASLSFAQQYGILKGTVTNKENNQPLPSANVMIKGTLIGTITDFDGNYSVQKIRTGKYILVVSMIGFRKEKISGVVIEAGKEKILNIRLEPAAVQVGQVVITAGKREQGFAEVPASVSVIDPQTFQRRNAITIDDALRQVSGVSLIESQVSIRGSSGYSKGVGSRTLMLVDGIPLLTGDTGELVFESVPTFNVDRIEILKGAASALYGSGAVGGVVNVLTKEIPDLPQTYFRLYGGFYDKPYHPEWEWSSKKQFINGFYVSHSQKFDDLKTLLAISRTEDDGYRQNSRWLRWNLYSKNQYQFTHSKKLKLSFNYIEQRRNNFLYWRNLDSALIPPADQLGDRVISKRFSASSLFTNIVTDRFTYSIKGVWYHTDWRNDVEVMGDRSISNFMDAEVQFNYQMFADHIFTLGVQGNYNRVRSDIFGNRSGFNTAFYLQDEYKMQDDLRFTFGTRIDYSKLDSLKSQFQINPKLGVAYSHDPLTSLRFSVGRAFRTPSASEAFTSTTASGITIIPNPSLKPEKSWNFEVGINRIVSKNINADASIFQTEYDNLIEAKFVSPFTGQFINVTRARIQGLEVSATTSFFENYFLMNLSYTYLKPMDRVENDILRFRSKHLFYVNSVLSYSNLEFGIDFRYISRIERIDKEFTLYIVDAEKRVPTYVIDTHISSIFKFGEVPLRSSFHINNLLQYNYVELIGNVAPIRNFVLRLETSL
ncbi:MAG: TonB-dependent receptor [Bacteroidota bacterium]|nr:TonB-dependent receptor [Bacteroidota bacterium]